MFNSEDPLPQDNPARMKRARRMAILKEIRFATGDYARKYLVDEPLLARRGEPGWDPAVEAEVRAALGHKQRRSLATEKILKSIEAKKWKPRKGYKTAPGGKDIVADVEGAVPGTSSKGIKAGIFKSLKDITVEPAKPEPLPPEMLPPGGIGKHQVGYGELTSSTGVPSQGKELWDYSEARKVHPVKETPNLTPRKYWRLPRNELEKEAFRRKVSTHAESFRDPIASHLARVKHGLTEDLRVAQERVQGEPKLRLPPAKEALERNRAQGIRDILAQRLVGYRKNVLNPLRAHYRKEAGLAPIAPLPKESIKSIHAARTISGEIGKVGKVSKVSPTPDIQVGPGFRTKPGVVRGLQRQFEGDLGRRLNKHKAAAERIRKDIHKRVNAEASGLEAGREIEEAAMARVKSAFDPGRTAQINPQDAYQISRWTGHSPEKVYEIHKSFRRHSYLGESQAGEDMLRRQIFPKSLKKVGSIVPPAAASGFPILKRTAIGAGIGAGLLGAGYLAHRLISKKKERQMSSHSKHIRFSNKDQRRSTLGHDVAVGGVEAGLGYLATEPLVHKYLRPKTALGRFGIAAGVGAVGTGTIGYLLNKAVGKAKNARRNRQEQQMSAILKEIRFDEGYATIYNPKKRLTVAQDRYRKAVREREIYRKEANLAKSALAGAALAGAIHGKLKPASLAIGAGAGLAAQTGLLLHGRTTRDPFGEETIASKRLERLPYQVGGLTAAGVLANRLRRKYFSDRKKLIQFQYNGDYVPPTPWHVKQARRWLKYPESRSRALEQTLGRTHKVYQDIRAKKTAEGQIIDERGRVRDPEWKKPWFRRAAIVGGITGTALLARAGYGKIRKTADVAKVLMAKDLPISSSERAAVNITTGNWARALGKKFPKASSVFSSASSRAGGFGERFKAEAKALKSRAYDKFNKAVEGQVGEVGVNVKKVGGKVKIDWDNPAAAAENIQRARQMQTRAEQARSAAMAAEQRAASAGKTRGTLEAELEQRAKAEAARRKAAEERKLHSLLKEIRFDVSVDEYYRSGVPVRSHWRGARSPQPKAKQKQYQQGLLTGLGLAGTAGGSIIGARYGYNRLFNKLSAEERAAEYAKDVASQVAKREAEILKSGVKPAVRASKKIIRGKFLSVGHLSKTLDKLIQFEQPKKKSGAHDRAKWGAISGGLTGGVSGATLGGYVATMHPEAIGAFTGEAMGEGIKRGMESMEEQIGEGWKPSGYGKDQPFSHGEFTPGEAKARARLHARKALNRKVIRRIGKFAGIGALGLGTVGAVSGYAASRAGTHIRQHQLSDFLDRLIQFKEKQDSPKVQAAIHEGKTSGSILGGLAGAWAGMLRGSETEASGSQIEGAFKGTRAAKRNIQADLARETRTTAERYDLLETPHGEQVKLLRGKKGKASGVPKFSGLKKGLRELPTRTKYAAQDALHGAGKWLTRPSMSRSVAIGATVGAPIGRYLLGKASGNVARARERHKKILAARVKATRERKQAIEIAKAHATADAIMKNLRASGQLSAKLDDLIEFRVFIPSEKERKKKLKTGYLSNKVKLLNM